MVKKLLYEQIKSYLVELIVNNRDIPEYKLPSEQQLAIKFNASRVSVRKALDLLEEEGVISRIRGRGTFIKNSLNTVALTTNATQMDCFMFILPDMSSNLMKNICNGMLTACKELNVKLLVLNSANSTQLERDNIATAMQLNCSGILLMPVDENKYNDSILSLSMSNFPTLFIDRRLYGLKFNCISSNHYKIGYNATNFLLNRGYEEILFFSLSRTISSVRQRIEGYESALSNHFNGKYRRYLLNVEDYMDNVQALYNDIYKYLQSNPQITGFIVGCGNPALYLVKALQSLGRVIGKDCDIVILDDDYAFLNILIDYDIPTIVQDGYNIGKTAVKMLYKNIKNNVPTEDKFIDLLKGCEV